MVGVAVSDTGVDVGGRVAVSVAEGRTSGLDVSAAKICVGCD